MQKFLATLTLSSVLLFSSCTKETQTANNIFKEDPNNYFTATFNGKTLKNTGFIFTTNGVADDKSGSLLVMNAQLNTSNVNGIVETDLVCSINGSLSNLSFGSLYKIPSQQLDSYLLLERTGNAVGTYKVALSGIPGFYFSNITDLTVGKKKYDIDPSTTNITVTTADLLWVQGTYTGNLLDGSTKIPVTGTFKLRKL